MALQGIDIFMGEISRRAKGSVKLPSMPKTATIKKIHNKKKADVIIKVNGNDKPLEDVPILGSNHKYDLIVTGEDVTYEHKKELNIKKGDKVVLAYIGGNFSDAVIVAKK